MDNDTQHPLSFDEVEARLVEAVRTSWRLPDREKGWLRVRIFWPEMKRHIRYGDYDARGGDMVSDDSAIRLASLTRAEVDAMEEAFGWLDGIKPADRKLVASAIGALARGEARVPWREIAREMGLGPGLNRLDRRYQQCIGMICRSINGSFAPVILVNPENRTQ